MQARSLLLGAVRQVLGGPRDLPAAREQRVTLLGHSADQVGQLDQRGVEVQPQRLVFSRERLVELMGQLAACQILEAVCQRGHDESLRLGRPRTLCRVLTLPFGLRPAPLCGLRLHLRHLHAGRAEPLERLRQTPNLVGAANAADLHGKVAA